MVFDENFIFLSENYYAFISSEFQYFNSFIDILESLNSRHSLSTLDQTFLDPVSSSSSLEVQPHVQSNLMIQ